ncbi:MAG: MFS transporter, partial [Thalassotalea sp.]|nr:MFS transporter [Thalassotalea sp.]
MNYTLVSVTLIMFIAAIVLAKGFKFPRNIWVLFVSQPLVLCVSPVITFIGGLLSSKIAPDPTLATLPLTFMIVGVALGTFSVAYFSIRLGRKKATSLGFIVGILATLLAMQAAITANFYLLIIAAFFLGVSLAFVQQLRFAALESVSIDDGPKVLSALMLSGILAAFIGPEIALMGKDWITSPHGYAGSFLGLSGLLVIALIIFQLFSNPHIATQEELSQPARPLSDIAKQPIFIIAMLSAAIGYGLMSFLMTATPISMHDMMGHSLEDTKWVLQSHVTAMFLPSLVTGYLIKRFGETTIMLVGTLMFALVAVIALQGQQVMHYWWALVLLGIGW